MGTIEIQETWIVIDKWWKRKPEWIEREFVAVDWNGHALTFYREAPDKVWRIWNSNHIRESH